MGGRAFGIAALVAGGLAWWFSRRSDAAGLYMPVDLAAATGPGTGAPNPSLDQSATDLYLARLSLAEDRTGDPLAKNPYSSASGLFQFTKGTWTGLGGEWGDDPSAPFGGLTPSADEQYAMAQKLTAANAAQLAAKGLPVDNVTLYAAHALGSIRRVANLFSADPSTPLSQVMGSAAAINPALGKTAGSAVSYFTRKVG